MKTIAMYNVKGGTGKTMTSINLAYEFSNLGFRTLLIDTDPQANSSTFYGLPKPAEPTLKSLLDSNIPEINSIKQVIAHSNFPNLDVVPSEIRLGSVEKQMLISTTIPQQFRLRNYLQEIKDDYDLVIIDSPPTAESMLNIIGLVASDYVFSPVRPGYWEMDGIKYMLEIIQSVKQVNYHLIYGGAILCAYEGNNVDKDTFAYLKQALSNQVLETKLPKSTIASQTTFEGIPISKYKPSAPLAQAYKNLAQEIKELIKL